MKKIFFIAILAFITSISGYSQNINSYRYVIVPNHYEFLKGTDQYQLNSLTKFLFEKYGFETFLEDESLPAELANNRCKALTAFVKDGSGLFSTKLTVGLKDCNNNVVFVSEEGLSRIKEYEQAYHEALREAFKSVNALNYNYDNSKFQVAEVKKEPKTSIAEESEPVAVAEVIAVPAPQNKQKSEAKVEEKVAFRVVPKPEKSKVVSEKSEMSFTNDGAMFYLKKSDNGYNLFQDSMSEPFAALITSNRENSFIYSSITNQGVAYFKENGDLVVEILDRSTNSTSTKIYSAKD